MNPIHPDIPSAGAPIPAVARPRLLYMAGPPEMHMEPMIQLLERAGIAHQSAASEPHSLHWQPVTNDELQDITPRLSERADAHLLLFYRAPAVVLAEAMGNGRPPDEALAVWLESIESMLAIVRQNRRRTTLVEVTLAQQEPARLIDRLNQRLALSLSKSEGDSGWPPQELDPVHLLIAHNAVLANTQARRLASELQATALPIADESSLLPESLNAWETYSRRVTEIESEHQRLLYQNNRLKKQLGDAESELKNAQARLNEAASRPVQTDGLKELKEENELLLQQLHHVQEELESYYLDGRDIQQKYEKAEAERKKLERDYNTALQRARMLQQRIDAMRASRSWRLTKPLRAGNIFKRSKKK